MPYLNFAASPIPVSQGPHAERGTFFALQIESREERNRLIESLRDLLIRPGTELRLALPGALTLFWKVKAGGTKLLLAHPEPTEWVGTISMTEAYVTELLRRLETGGRIWLTELGEIHPVSNLELRLEVVA